MRRGVSPRVGEVVGPRNTEAIQEGGAPELTAAYIEAAHLAAVNMGLSVVPDQIVLGSAARKFIEAIRPYRDAAYYGFERGIRRALHALRMREGYNGRRRQKRAARQRAMRRGRKIGPTDGS